MPQLMERLRTLLHRMRRRPRSFAKKFGNTGPFGTDIPIKERFRTRRRVGRAMLIICALILLNTLILSLSYTWRVKRVTATEGQRYSATQLVEYSGLAEGDAMLGFDDAQVEARLKEVFPMLSSVRVTRRLNGTVNIKAKEVSDAYYTYHNGNYYLLSATDFRVLAIRSDTAAWDAFDLVYFGLPEEARLRHGETLKYAWLPYPPVGAENEVSTYELETGTAEEEFRYVEKTLKAVINAPFSDRLTGVELGDRYDLWMILDGRIKVLFGSSRDMDTKLAQVAQVLARQDESELPAVLDVSDPARATYREVADLVLPSWAS